MTSDMFQAYNPQLFDRAIQTPLVSYVRRALDLPNRFSRSRVLKLVVSPNTVGSVAGIAGVLTAAAAVSAQTAAQTVSNTAGVMQNAPEIMTSVANFTQIPDIATGARLINILKLHHIPPTLANLDMVQRFNELMGTGAVKTIDGQSHLLIAGKNLLLPFDPMAAPTTVIHETVVQVAKNAPRPDLLPTLSDPFWMSPDTWLYAGAILAGLAILATSVFLVRALWKNVSTTRLAPSIKRGRERVVRGSERWVGIARVYRLNIRLAWQLLRRPAQRTPSAETDSSKTITLSELPVRPVVQTPTVTRTSELTLQAPETDSTLPLTLAGEPTPVAIPAHPPIPVRRDRLSLAAEDTTQGSRLTLADESDVVQELAPAKHTRRLRAPKPAMTLPRLKDLRNQWHAIRFSTYISADKARDAYATFVADLQSYKTVAEAKDLKQWKSFIAGVEKPYVPTLTALRGKYTLVEASKLKPVVRRKPAIRKPSPARIEILEEMPTNIIIIPARARLHVELPLRLLDGEAAPAAARSLAFRSPVESAEPRPYVAPRTVERSANPSTRSGFITLGDFWPQVVEEATEASADTVAAPLYPFVALRTDSAIDRALRVLAPPFHVNGFPNPYPPRKWMLALGAAPESVVAPEPVAPTADEFLRHEIMPFVAHVRAGQGTREDLQVQLNSLEKKAQEQGLYSTVSDTFAMAQVLIDALPAAEAKPASDRRARAEARIAQAHAGSGPSGVIALPGEVAPEETPAPVETIVQVVEDMAQQSARSSLLPFITQAPEITVRYLVPFHVNGFKQPYTAEWRQTHGLPAVLNSVDNHGNVTLPFLAVETQAKSPELAPGFTGSGEPLIALTVRAIEQLLAFNFDVDPATVRMETPTPIAVPEPVVTSAAATPSEDTEAPTASIPQTSEPRFVAARYADAIAKAETAKQILTTVLGALSKDVTSKKYTRAELLAELAAVEPLIAEKPFGNEKILAMALKGLRDNILAMKVEEVVPTEAAPTPTVQPEPTPDTPPTLVVPPVTPDEVDGGLHKSHNSREKFGIPVTDQGPSTPAGSPRSTSWRWGILGTAAVGLAVWAAPVSLTFAKMTPLFLVASSGTLLLVVAGGWGVYKFINREQLTDDQKRIQGFKTLLGVQTQRTDIKASSARPATSATATPNTPPAPAVEKVVTASGIKLPKQANKTPDDLRAELMGKLKLLVLGLDRLEGKSLTASAFESFETQANRLLRDYRFRLPTGEGFVEESKFIEDTRTTYRARLAAAEQTQLDAKSAAKPKTAPTVKLEPQGTTSAEPKQDRTTEELTKAVIALKAQVERDTSYSLDRLAEYVYAWRGMREEQGYDQHNISFFQPYGHASDAINAYERKVKVNGRWVGLRSILMRNLLKAAHILSSIQFSPTTSVDQWEAELNEMILQAIHEAQELNLIDPSRMNRLLNNAKQTSDDRRHPVAQAITDIRTALAIVRTLKEASAQGVFDVQTSKVQLIHRYRAKLTALQPEVEQFMDAWPVQKARFASLIEEHLTQLSLVEDSLNASEEAPTLIEQVPSAIDAAGVMQQISGAFGGRSQHRLPAAPMTGKIVGIALVGALAGLLGLDTNPVAALDLNGFLPVDTGAWLKMFMVAGGLAVMSAIGVSSWRKRDTASYGTIDGSDYAPSSSSPLSIAPIIGMVVALPLVLVLIVSPFFALEKNEASETKTSKGSTLRRPQRSLDELLQDARAQLNPKPAKKAQIQKLAPTSETAPAPQPTVTAPQSNSRLWAWAIGVVGLFMSAGGFIQYLRRRRAAAPENDVPVMRPTPTLTAKVVSGAPRRNPDASKPRAQIAGAPAPERIKVTDPAFWTRFERQKAQLGGYRNYESYFAYRKATADLIQNYIGLARITDKDLAKAQADRDVALDTYLAKAETLAATDKAVARVLGDIYRNLQAEGVDVDALKAALVPLREQILQEATNPPVEEPASSARVLPFSRVNEPLAGTLIALWMFPAHVTALLWAVGLAGVAAFWVAKMSSQKYPTLRAYRNRAISA